MPRRYRPTGRPPGRPAGPPRQHLSSVPDKQMLSHWFDAMASALQQKHFICGSPTAAWTLKLMLYNARKHYKALWQRHNVSVDKRFPLDAFYISHDKATAEFTILPNPVWNIVEVVDGKEKRTQFEKLDPGLERAYCYSLLSAAADHVYNPLQPRGKGTIPIDYKSKLDPNTLAALEVIEANTRPRITDTEAPPLDSEDLDLP